MLHRTFCLLLFATVVPVAMAASRTPAQVEARAAQLRPRPDETRWMQIPWVRSVIEGERLARAEHRPIMLWNVDYDPLERCWGGFFGLRAGPFNDPEVVRLVSENYIPVAINKQEIVQTPGAQLRHAEEQRLIKLLTKGRSTNLGVFLSTADGQQLTDKEIFRMQSTPQVAATLRAALARFGAVTPRHVRPTWQEPDRGAGVRPDGSVRLALTIRFVDHGDYTSRPTLDSIILSARQWQGLRPPSGQAGARYVVPDEVARQFSRAIGAGSDPSYMLRPEDLTTAGMTGTVTGSDARGVTISLAGRLAGMRHQPNGYTLPGQAVIEGELLLAPDGRPQRLVMISDGTFKLPWDHQPRPTGAVVDWQAGVR